jgi:sigma-B regulation protein RsbU (phosphoserine phosphatase)
LELAAEVQRDLLPARLLQPPGFRFAAFLAPARTVGGDLYDVIQLDDEHIGILIADVADKGLHAALMMAVTRTLFFQESKRTLSPAEVTCGVHEALMAVGSARESGRDAFVTAFYGVIHLPSGALHYVRAAHERPLLMRPGHKPMALQGGGRFLGMIPDLNLDEYQVQLLPGDCLLLFSDGVTDAQNALRQNYGHERLAAVLALAGQLDAASVVRAVVDDVAAWTGDAEPFDDLALLVVKVEPLPSGY